MQGLFVLAMSTLGRAPHLRRVRRLGRWPLVLLAIFAAMLGALLADRFARHRAAERSRAALVEALPRQDLTGPYVASLACKACHPNEYASWHASYHRQMTQPATPDAVKASFNGEQFDLGDATARLSRRGDEFWVEVSGAANDGEDLAEARRVVMTTGSHHMQGYWVARGSVSSGGVSGGGVASNNGNLLDQLPLMWLTEEVDPPGRWVPIADSFLTPQGSHVESLWNASCIFCHSVRGRPRLDRRTMAARTTVAELGIACEACHGPGRKHIEFHRHAGATSSRIRENSGLGEARENSGLGDAPLTGFSRSRLRGEEKSKPAHANTDDTIIHPAHLSPERSAQVCGHCHSVAKFTSDELLEDWYRSGSAFRPGDDLSLTRLTMLPGRLPPDELEAFQKTHGAFLEGNFWPDGMVRVAGREYNGLVESACYQQGGMTCISCHSLHQSDPNDQLAAGMDGNQACYPCHESYRDTLTSHTHHSATSSGSLCYNCHMPHTTYGLFKGIRSHQITSPKVSATLSTGRPNACNLCHLDQTLGWASEKLAEWYTQPQAELDDDHRQIVAGVLWLLRGDAVQRALAAYAAAWPSAREASGEDWQPPFLAPLLDDPYAAVRLVAHRSLQRLGWQLEYDFIGTPEHRARAAREVLAKWRSRSGDRRRVGGQRLLLDDEGRLRDDLVDQLIGQRDDRPITIQE